MVTIQLLSIEIISSQSNYRILVKMQDTFYLWQQKAFRVCLNFRMLATLQEVVK